MVVMTKTAVVEFGRHHADARPALDEWYHKTCAADWRNFAQMQQTFNSVDAVGQDRYVFNIKGNRYRLVALIFFQTATADRQNVIHPVYRYPCRVRRDY